jgi:hypothetical protein
LSTGTHHVQPAKTRVRRDRTVAKETLDWLYSVTTQIE